MNPYGPEIQTDFVFLLGEYDPNWEKGGIHESPPDRYVPNSSPAQNMLRQEKAPKLNFLWPEMARVRPSF